MEKIIKYVIDNWALIVAAISILVVAIVNVVDFFKKPTEEQIAAVKSWLLWATSEAERILGSGTGKLKLRYVYDMFIEKFPYVAKFLSFDQFSEYVDEALEEMKKLIESNSKVQQYITSSVE